MHQAIIMPTITIGTPPITLRVPCAERAVCYAKELTETLAFRGYKPESSGFTIAPEAIQSALESLIKILDSQAIKFIDSDLWEYRDEQKLEYSDPEQAIREYKRYFTAPTRTPFPAYMERTFPVFTQLKDTLCKNFLKNMLKTFKRLDQDMSILREGFLNDLGQNISLVNIGSTNSEFHRQGQQVLILTFFGNGNTKKVVYKPSAVQTDAMLVGDVKRLGQLDQRYAKQYSLLEALNRGLERANQKPLPTYLIIPREDKTSAVTTNRYGYVEYLSHGPWFDSAFDVLEPLEKIRPAERMDTARTLCDTAINTALQSAAASKKCDYVTRDPHDVEQYSYDCGVLLILILIAGLSDRICDNFIIHHLRPYMIDAEICFEPGHTITNALCFNVNVGAMKESSGSYIEKKWLFDISGMNSVNIHYPDKNLLFFADNDQLTACQPENNACLAGYRVALDIVAYSPDVLVWFAQEPVRCMPIRILTASTHIFEIELNNFYDDKPDNDKIESRRASFLQCTYENYEENVNQYIENAAKASTAEQIPLPYSSVAWWNPSPQTNVRSEYRASSIPCYATLASERKLYDYNDRVVSVPEKFQLLQRKADPHHEYHGQEFFPEPPINLFERRIKTFVDEKKSKDTKKAEHSLSMHNFFSEQAKVTSTTLTRRPDNKHTKWLTKH